MIWALIFIIAFVVYLAVIRWNNIYSVIFSLAFFSMNILLFAYLLFIIKMSNYRYWFQAEYIVYAYISRLRISFFDIQVITNIAVILFLLSMLLLALQSGYRIRRLRRYIVYSALFAAVAVWILHFNSEHFYEKVYIMTHKPQSLSAALALKRIISFVNYAAPAVICILPAVNIIQARSTTRIRFRKKYLTALFVSYLTLIAMFCCIMLFTPMRFFYGNFDMYNFGSLGVISASTAYAVVPAVVVALITVVIVFLIKYNILEERSFIKKRFETHRTTMNSEDLRHVFHSYKNAMFSIVTLAERSLSSYGTDGGRDDINQIINCANSYSVRATEYLDMYNKDITYDGFNLSQTINEAIKRTAFPDYIRISKDFETTDDIVYGDFQALVEVFENLFINSVEAIEKKGDGSGKISVSLWIEDKYACVSVRDNGIGISKKVFKKLFTPFFTTKQTFKNWGIGLAHIKSTINLHDGYIDADGRENEYAEFQIVLPLDV